MLAILDFGRSRIDVVRLRGWEMRVTTIQRSHGRHAAFEIRGVKRMTARCIGAAALLAVGAGAAAAQQMSLPGNFSVTASGAATYDIAIAVPPGTAGMVPSLN